MFGGKKTKEAENRIQRLEETKFEYIHLLDELKRTKTVSDEVFVTIEAGDAQLDQSLNQIVDLLKSGDKSSRKLQEKVYDFSEKMGKISSLYGSKGEEERYLEESSEEYQKSVALMQEIDKQCELIAKEQEENKEKQESILQQSSEQILKMQNAAKNMTVLSLNAAIKAGRLGESGADFLHAAEDIRKLSEEYSKMISELSEQMALLTDMTEEYHRSQEERMDTVQKKVTEAGNIKDMQKDITTEEAEDAKVKKLIEEQIDAAGTITEHVKEVEESYQNALNQMEIIGENYMDSRRAKEELEEQLSKIYEQVTG